MQAPTRPLDPQWAWSRFVPDKERPWDRAAAAHFFRRSGFSATSSDLDRAVNDGFESTVEKAFEIQEPAGFQNEMNALVRAGLASGSMQHLAAQWLFRMLQTPVPLLEKTTLFWHGHFATSADKVADADLMQTQNDLLRRFAMGDFSALLLEISRDPAMLIYLDSASNRKSHPNENYAREIMELFCLGEGNYTETDIRELARCFTGWEIKRKKFRFNRYQHDRGEKSILGQTGAFGGEDGVRIVAEQDAGPVFLSGKLVRFFVADEIALSREFLKPLADQLRKDDWNVAPTIRRILTSQVFFSQHARARKIRSPVEVAVDFLRAFDGTTDLYRLAGAVADLGQGLYHPPSVKGWDGGRSWINSSTLLGRANLIRQILDHGKTRFGQTNLPEYLANQNVRSGDELIDFAERLLFATTIPESAKTHVRKMASDSMISMANVTKSRSSHPLTDALHFLCSLPEFQLS